MSTKTRWAILGLGRIAHKFASDLVTLANADLVAVASTDQGRANEFAAHYPRQDGTLPRALGTYEALLDMADEIDVVYIATRHVYHRANTLLCLNGGLAVLCEKPFGMAIGDVNQMLSVAEARQTFLMEALWSRFMPTILQAKAWLDEGAIGNVLTIKADFGFKAEYDPGKRLFNKELGGGSLLDIGIYPLFISYLINGMPVSITAAATLAPTGADEQCGMILTYSNGAMAVLNSTFMANTENLALIYGTEGTIRIHGRFHESTVATLEKPDAEPITKTFDRTTHGYDYEAQHVMDCLSEGFTESPLWSHSDSRNLMTLLDDVRNAAGIVYE
ncbi:Gfo/Idh/MocA family protein [Fibrivirga algicola]|uniref:Gfo/Idh/MocA family oxidoreductase n=1 Tax=Fibrivirga algicola TaxID=2950420 RepID=A0ABX0QEC2_9BACT|nr:Gfo/Idh/MocA family oxidoreductase [Fibrivirga algicola]ARK09381.1 oxidoreductase [Fibrella sp. ES10-3-2-2]NID10253.1 Gfo/Idh/MocA family oxidoreductase [Fibrivirga algicola]